MSKYIQELYLNIAFIKSTLGEEIMYKELRRRKSWVTIWIQVQLSVLCTVQYNWVYCVLCRVREADGVRMRGHCAGHRVRPGHQHPPGQGELRQVLHLNMQQVSKLITKPNMVQLYLASTNFVAPSLIVISKNPLRSTDTSVFSDKSVYQTCFYLF